MIHRILFMLTTLLVFTNSVANKDDGGNKEVVNANITQPKYNFNHPPSADDYNPIHVDIVYNDDNGGSKQIKSISDDHKPNKINQNKPINDVKNDKISSQLQEENSVPLIINGNIRTNSKPTPKPRALEELQIPVQVVYEDVSSDMNKNIETKSDTTTETPKRGRNYRRKYENKANAIIPNKQIQQETRSAESETEKPVTKFGPRTFPKRVGGHDPVVPIVDSESYVFSHSGNFHYRYEGGDGTIAYSEGKLKNIDGGTGETVKGGFSYTDQEGNDFSLSYTADENGYRPVGAHLPTPPPIPPAIARALEYLATATQEPVTKRSTKHGSV